MSAPQIDAPAELGSITPPEHIPQVGPVEPYPGPQRWATVTALPSAEATGPIEPITDPQDNPGSDAEASEFDAPTEDTTPVSTERWSAASEPTVDEPSRESPLPESDPEPAAPARPKRSQLRYATVAGYWMSVSVGAAGQIWSLGSLIDQGPLGYAVAALGAAFAEVTMIGAGKWARENRIDGKPWKLLLVLAGIVCAYATLMNAIHWIQRSVGMAVMFAGGSVMGFAVETTVEHIDAADYRRKNEKYEDDLRRWQNRQVKARPAAPARSSTPASPRRPAAAPAATNSPTKSSARSRAAAKPAAKTKKDALLAEIVTWAQANDAGPRKACQAFAGHRGLPSESTVKRELAQARNTAS